MRLSFSHGNNSMNDLLYAFQINFPTFLYCLIGPDAPVQLRIASFMIVLSIIIAITSLLIFQAKSIVPFIMLIILALVEYGLFISVEGFGTGESTIFLIIYIV